MAVETVHLLEIEPDLARFLGHEDRLEAAHLTLPVRRPARGPMDPRAVLARPEDFGMLVLTGMVLERMRLGSHVTMKLFGPGDLVPPVGQPGSMLISESSLSAGDGTRVAVLGHEMLIAFHRWPGIAAALHVRTGEQAERLAVQLAICQQPRVEERLLALMWWLAEAWGRVTSVGTVVPISMTHDVLGALVGARRPTITLALGELVERGAIVRQDQGWLLLEPAPTSSREPAEVDDPALIPPRGPSWRDVTERPEGEEAAIAAAHLALLETVSRLRTEHALSAEAVSERLRAVRESRERMLARRRSRESATRPPPAPSTGSRPPRRHRRAPAAEE